MARLDPTFDEFLFSSVGTERNGMILSVVSALARLDLDPWQEAAKLAALPPESAIRRLGTLFAALPDGALVSRDTVKVATALVARLPHQVYSALQSSETLLTGGRITWSRGLMYLIFLVLVLCAPWIASSGPSTAGRADSVASSTISPPGPAPSPSDGPPHPPVP
ncbi:MAG: hypothetical protein P4M00_01020 [Azospirillaceae bacterium]|nr:hypothetical protein [Azospirillaceae bacterium]